MDPWRISDELWKRYSEDFGSPDYNFLLFDAPRIRLPLLADVFRFADHETTANVHQLESPHGDEAERLGAITGVESVLAECAQVSPTNRQGVVTLPRLELTAFIESVCGSQAALCNVEMFFTILSMHGDARRRWFTEVCELVVNLTERVDPAGVTFFCGTGWDHRKRRMEPGATGEVIWRRKS